jgi:hypothetical protein
VARTEVRLALASIDDMEQLFAALESLLEERHENFVLFVLRMKERADMAMLFECATGETDGRRWRHM